MNLNYLFNDVEEALPPLLALMETADEVGSRNGRTREMTHVSITLGKPTRREVLVPERRVNLAAQIAESAWVLAGRNDIEWLAHYLPRAHDFSDDGKTWRGGYGPRLRSWPVRDGENVSVVDQLAYVVETLRDQPLSRQAVVSLWDPQVDTNPGLDRPCNDLLIFTNRLGYLDLHVTLRSNDLFWGWSGINAFEWSVLQEVVAKLLGVNVGKLHFSTASLHVYDKHWPRSRKIVEAEPIDTAGLEPSPSFNPAARNLDHLDRLLADWFKLEELIRLDVIGTPAGEPVDAAIDAFPEPMLRSWLQVLQWWWSGGDPLYLDDLQGTRLYQAALMSHQPPKPAPTHSLEEEKIYTFGNPKPFKVITKHTPFLLHAQEIHLTKDAAYGDSWKRRGEQMSIMANIARKVDRLGSGETDDETQADTALDLFVYLAKYRVWLAENGLGAPGSGRTVPNSSDPKVANRVMETVERNMDSEVPPRKGSEKELEDALKTHFEELAVAVEADESRYPMVDTMLANAYILARLRWEHQEWKARNEKRMWKGYE